MFFEKKNSCDKSVTYASIKYTYLLFYFFLKKQKKIGFLLYTILRIKAIKSGQKHVRQRISVYQFNNKFLRFLKSNQIIVFIVKLFFHLFFSWKKIVLITWFLEGKKKSWFCNQVKPRAKTFGFPRLEQANWDCFWPWKAQSQL